MIFLEKISFKSLKVFPENWTDMILACILNFQGSTVEFYVSQLPAFIMVVYDSIMDDQNES